MAICFNVSVSSMEPQPNKADTESIPEVTLKALQEDELESLNACNLEVVGGFSLFSISLMNTEAIKAINPIWTTQYQSKPKVKLLLEIFPELGNSPTFCLVKMWTR